MQAVIKSVSAPAVPIQSAPYTLNVTPTVGDWMLALWTGEAAGSAFPTPPTGWTTVLKHGGMNAAATASFGVYAKKYESGADLVWSMGANSNPSRVTVVVGSGGADISAWTLGAFVPRATNATTTTAVAPAVTATSAGLSISMSAERTVAAETSGQLTVSGSTKFHEDITGSSTILVLANKRVAAAETAGPVTFTFPNTHANNAIAGTIIIPDAPDPVSANTGMPIRMATAGGFQNLTLKVASGSGLETPQAMKVVSSGYGSVQAMLATPQFKVAHRGGSVDFAEMSLYGYGQSALLGYKALELSLSQTSDGVLFGMHDDTMLRTSGVDLNPANLTWAEVQKYQILSSQPYMRWEELLDLYPNHVIFIDSKAIPYRNLGPILDVLDTKGGPDRFVYKYYGATKNHTLPKSRGYKTWGYFYEVNVPTLSEWQDGWDILGMEYTGSTASWDAIKSYGKPVMGHICPNLAAATTALNKGAAGLMVSGVKSVPV